MIPKVAEQIDHDETAQRINIERRFFNAALSADYQEGSIEVFEQELRLIKEEVATAYSNYLKYEKPIGV